MSDYFVCPICGAEVPEKALACPECGSDDSTGWSEDTIYDGTGIEFFDEPEPPARESLFLNKQFLWFVALAALLAFIFFYIL